MLNTKEVLYSLDDVAIQPASESFIEHRGECNTLIDGFLPIFTSPMPNVVDENTLDLYINAKINPVIPRSCGTFESKLSLSCDYDIFAAYSLDEAERLCECEQFDDIEVKVLIDIANGNMSRLMSIIERIKLKYPQFIIMAGNVANPETYKLLCDCGADYVRLSVGTGSACNTATFTGIYYPMASLIDKCASMNLGAKIIADGGISNYRNAIKALALGADYVMMGGALNKLKDSAGIIQEVRDINGEWHQYKLYYGMASIKGQEKLNRKNISAPEGKTVMNPISDMTIAEFANEFDAYLKSSMSYCNIKDIKDFRNVNTNIISESAQKQFNKD